MQAGWSRSDLLSNNKILLYTMSPTTGYPLVGDICFISGLCNALRHFTFVVYYPGKNPAFGTGVFDFQSGFPLLLTMNRKLF
jgi:hypothetical protein